MQSPVVKAGVTRSPSPHLPLTKEKTKKNKEAQPDASRPGDGKQPLPYRFPVRGPSPPASSPSPSCSPSSSSSPHFLPLFITRWGNVSDHLPDVCFWKDRSAFVGLSSPKNKAILGDFECFHRRDVPRLWIPGTQASQFTKGVDGSASHPATSPAPVRRRLVGFIAQVIANRCMPGPRGPCVRSWVVSYVAFGVCVCVCVCVCVIF